jgi:phosphotransferase system  glucose/maltose/N-acetylglucosamine-specific IIC component
MDNKWVYYELTDEAKEILHPHKMTKIIVLLSSAILSFVAGIAEAYRFVRSIFLSKGVPALGMSETVHLIIGLILILLGFLLLHLLNWSMRATGKNGYINFCLLFGKSG